MPGLIVAPLLAVDVDTLIGIGVFLVWVVGWVLKLVSGQAQKGPPVANRPRPPARPRDERLQEEIDIFIQEVGPKKPARRPQPAARQPAPAKPSAARRGAPAAEARRDVAPKAPIRRLRPGQEIAERQAPVTGNLGTGVEQHLKQFMADKVSHEVASHLRHSVTESVAQHLGAAAGPATTASTSYSTGAPPATRSGLQLSELFRNPESLRQAMVINMILSPPPGRTRSASR